MPSRKRQTLIKKYNNKPQNRIIGKSNRRINAITVVFVEVDTDEVRVKSSIIDLINKQNLMWRFYTFGSRRDCFAEGKFNWQLFEHIASQWK